MQTQLHRERGRALAYVLFACLLLGAASAHAQHVNFTASVDPQQCAVGDPITLTLTIESSDNVSATNFVMPDLGGLTRTGEAGRSTQNQQGQGQRIYTVFYTWGLLAPAPGEYTIGPAQLSIDGRVYRTQPLKVTVAKQPDLNIPGDLSKENILFAQTDDPSLNQQLRGKIFLRPEISNLNPWVGEPVIISYSLYVDQVPIAGNMSRQVPTSIPGAVSSVLVDPTQLQFQQREVGGRLYQVALAYRLAVTPNTAGKIEFDGYMLQVPLSRQRRSGGDPFDAFGSFPFFSNAIQVNLPTPRVSLDVKALPTPAPADFSGTIGDFSLSGKLDRTAATEDDLLTLNLTLDGHGAIELANAPTLPPMPDFELSGQSNQVASRSNSTEIGGSKTFEYILRPLRSGKLQIPALSYAIFDPFAGAYRSQEIPAQSVMIAPGKAPASSFKPGTAAAAAHSPLNDLLYLKPIESLQRERTMPWVESPTFWSGQILLGALFCGVWVRRRRLDRLDPAQARRSRAGRAFERRLRELPANDPVRAAELLDQAARGFIADRHNTSPEGLTRPEIERLLQNGALDAERAGRVCDLLDELHGLRYSPIQPTHADVESRADALRILLREGLR